MKVSPFNEGRQESSFFLTAVDLENTMNLVLFAFILMRQLEKNFEAQLSPAQSNFRIPLAFFHGHLQKIAVSSA